MIINYQHFVPKGTKINLAKYCLARVFWNRLFRQPLYQAGKQWRENCPAMKPNRLPL